MLAPLCSQSHPGLYPQDSNANLYRAVNVTNLMGSSDLWWKTASLFVLNTKHCKLMQILHSHSTHVVTVMFQTQVSFILVSVQYRQGDIAQ